MEKRNETALITGASSDIGIAITKKLASMGYNVIIHYFKNKDAALNLEKEIIHNYCVKTLVINADISSTNEVNNMINTTLKGFPQIDVLINNAGIAIDNDIYDKTKEEFLRVLEVNLIGTFLVTKEVSKNMKTGTIINISSTDGIDTYNDLSMDYCASKAGINSLTKTLAMRFSNLKVLALAPNWVKTKSVLEMDPQFLKNELARIGQKELLTTEEVANKIKELIIDDNITSGSIIRLDK